MPLRLVRSRSNGALWSACRDRFLDQLSAHTGPTGYESHLWLTHRLQRDALYREAARRGLAGWLEPPIAFFSELPRLFDIRERPVSLLRRRAAIGRLAAQHGERLGIAARFRFDRLGIGHSADQLLGDLLPEAVTPEQLAHALAALDGDDFSRRRNDWIVAVYRDYLQELARENRYDPRAIHSLVAQRIDEGELPGALNGARTLHVYGLWTLRTRRRLIDALATQNEVEVVTYVLAEDEPGEWDAYGLDGEAVAEPPGVPAPPAPPAPLLVTPVPDARREFEWIALQVKRLLLEGSVQPHEIAVVARSGREDTLRAYEIFQAAAIPGTARIRSSLAEVPALKAVLQLLRAAGSNWKYRPLRHVLESPYFDIDLDLRSIDRIAREQRIEGLDRWSAELEALREAAGTADDRRPLERQGIFLDRLERDCAAFRDFATTARDLERQRTPAQWIARTRELLDPGWFDFRRGLCRPPGDRWEVVRLDQQGVEAVVSMLREWEEIEEPGPATGPDQWYPRLRRFLAANEIALSTPLKHGVQLLEAHEAALFPFRHTFVVHANDGEFPLRPATGGLFAEEERAALANTLPIASRQLGMRRERALWRAVTAAANVTITYRTADPNGIPLLPSLMVPEHDPSTEIPRTRYAWDEPFSLAHTRRTATLVLARNKQQHPGARLRLPEIEPIRHAILGACAESQRSVGRDRPPGTLGAWNGHLRDPWLVRYLHERFGEDRIWSASQLEQYAQCPFVYLVQRVLYLDQLVEAEEETTPLAFGGVAHDLLQAFYGEYKGPFPTEFVGPVTHLFHEVAERVLAAVEQERALWLGLPPLWRVTRREIVERVAEFLAWELPRLRGRSPAHRELSFGEESDAVVIAGNDLAGRAARLRLRGRIDRVDVAEGSAGPVYHIVDYKSGSTPSPSGYLDGGTLQTPLYMAAATRHLGASVETGSYRSIRHRKEGAKVRRGHEHFERALTIGLSIPGRVRQGRFEPRAANSCKWRDYWPGAAICRVTAVVEEGCRFDE